MAVKSWADWTAFGPCGLSFFNTGKVFMISCICGWKGALRIFMISFSSVGSFRISSVKALAEGYDGWNWSSAQVEVTSVP